jgi:PTS system nitrogen regulatory IIA component
MADVFDLDGLAAYLHMSRDLVAKMADRGKLPGRKVAGEWRFSHAEIHHWLEERIGVWDDAELSRLETALDRQASVDDGAFSLADRLPLEGVAVPLVARTKNSIIDSMAELAAATGHLWDPTQMAAAVRQREELYPTALETGVALLHPRRPLTSILAEPVLALGITSQGVPCGSARGLTDIFFLIASVDDRGHLRTLARLSRLIGSEGLLSALRAAPDAATARNCLLEADERLPAA